MSSIIPLNRTQWATYILLSLPENLLSEDMQKRWVECTKANEVSTNRLATEIQVSEVIARLLLNRGINNFEEAKNFFRPQIEHLHDPFEMKDMLAAIERIEKAIAGGEKVLIYGDYDVDGTTSVSLVYSFFHPIYKQLDYYIPNRYSEGYGISFQGIDWAEEHGYSLIIALDCGIKSVDKVLYANEKSIDFIICDHHLPGDELPAAVAVLDPKRNDCTYPFKELSGCGIGFKLIQAYSMRNNIAMEKLMPYLDLVAVSIASDIVPVTGENRILAFYGLKQINSKPRHGLQALLDLAGNKQKIDISDIVFMIGPRINAAGRMDDAKQAVHLLIAGDKETAFAKGAIVNTKNSERKEFDQSITAEALQMIEDENLIDCRSTVLFKADWHKGVTGIVASRLIEKYYRPTIVLSQSNGLATGSARSVNEFDVHEAISACSELLEQFGGHKYAAGLSLKLENVPAFRQRFEEVVAASIKEESLYPIIEIDAPLSLNEIDAKFIRIMNQIAPFGPGNMRPMFHSKMVWAERAQIVGQKHLRFYVQQEGSEQFPCIAFNLGEYEGKISKGIPFDICYTIEENEWNGKVNLQLNIKDIKLAGN